VAERAYLVKGTDELLANAIRTLVDGFKAESLDVEELGGDDLTAASIVEACNAFFLGGGDKAVVVREAERFKAADEIARLVGYLADPNPQSSLVLVLTGENKKLVDGFRKAKATIVDAVVPGGKGRRMWLDDRLATAALKLDRGAANRLADHLGEDLGRLPGILEILEAVHGAGAKIVSADLDPVLGDAGGSAPWDLTDAIDKGEVTGALVHLRRMLAGRHPFVVLASLWGHYQRMLRLDGSGARSETEAAALLNIKGSTYPAKKALTQSRKLGHDGIRRAVQLLQTADLDLRGVRDLPDVVILEVLVARLARLSR
jgi:DNA polymerase-3 subunit delta